MAASKDAAIFFGFVHFLYLTAVGTKREHKHRCRPAFAGCGGGGAAVHRSRSRRLAKRPFGQICSEKHVMKMFFTAVACTAFVCVGAICQPAIAQQKTAKECNAEWASDKAALQASGKTKRAFVAECRGVPLAAAAPKAATLEKGQFATEAEANTNCPNDSVVWVNLRSGVY